MRVTQGAFSFLPDFTDEQIAAQIRYALDKGWSMSVEHTDDAHPRNSYWEMWAQPSFELLPEDYEVVLGEEDVRRGERIGVAGAGDGDAPELAGAMEGFGDVAAKDECAGGGSALEESFVERAARERLGGEGES